jgi:predicted pyridoxine 5'-phosphate oxidase superfamily flavin-nucleotide-binding protein
MRRYADLMFTPRVRRIQEQLGSRAAYERLFSPSKSGDDRLTTREAAFINKRDSFYMATVGETGWPYVQHRGGPAGFVKVLDDRTIGFADYSGNKQYISAGNLLGDDRASFFFMDYPSRWRLKLLGHVRAVIADDEPELARRLTDAYPASVERRYAVRIEGFDWNCPQHITPRFSADELEAALDHLRGELRELQQENERLQAALCQSGGPTSS